MDNQHGAYDCGRDGVTSVLFEIVMRMFQTVMRRRWKALLHITRSRDPLIAEAQARLLERRSKITLAVIP